MPAILSSTANRSLQRAPIHEQEQTPEKDFTMRKSTKSNKWVSLIIAWPIHKSHMPERFIGRCIRARRNIEMNVYAPDIAYDKRVVIHPDWIGILALPRYDKQKFPVAFPTNGRSKLDELQRFILDVAKKDVSTCPSLSRQDFVVCNMNSSTLRWWFDIEL